MEVKECFKCQNIKPLDEFYKHPAMSDGYLGKCKSCAREDTEKNYKIKIQDPNWRNLERKRTRERNKRLGYWEKLKATATLEQRKRLREIKQKWAKANPDKIKAQRKVRYAIKAGKLKKEACAVCGNKKSEAHHPDYSKPLEIVWLCRKHHAEAHWLD